MTEEERAQMAALRKDVDALLREQENQERQSIRSIQNARLHRTTRDGVSWGDHRDEKRARDLWHESGSNPVNYMLLLVEFIKDDIDALEDRLEELLVSLAEPQLHPPQVTATDLLEEIRQRRSR